MAYVSIHLRAKNELDQLWESDPAAAAAVQVALEQLSADPKFIDKLTTHGENFAGAERINVKRWIKLQRFGNIWRFRILDTSATSYRVFYGYHYQTRQICVFAIVHKDKIDYDNPESELASRIVADWRLL